VRGASGVLHTEVCGVTNAFSPARTSEKTCFRHIRTVTPLFTQLFVRNKRLSGELEFADIV